MVKSRSGRDQLCTQCRVPLCIIFVSNHLISMKNKHSKKSASAQVVQPGTSPVSQLGMLAGILYSIGSFPRHAQLGYSHTGSKACTCNCMWDTCSHTAFPRDTAWKGVVRIYTIGSFPRLAQLGYWKCPRGVHLHLSCCEANYKSLLLGKHCINY